MRIGRLDDEDAVWLNQALLAFLGLASQAGRKKVMAHARPALHPSVRLTWR